MIKYSLPILGSFILGIALTLFFVNVNFAFLSTSPRGEEPAFSANVIEATVATTTTTAISSAYVVGATSTIPNFVINMVPATTTSKKYEYKLLHEVDPCTMNKLGTQGWQLFQIGGTIDNFFGMDENCKDGRARDVLDWVLFSRDNQ